MDKLIKHSISSCNKLNKANSFAAEKETDFIIRKNTDSSSSVPKEHDSDLKTGKTHNLKKYSYSK